MSTGTVSRFYYGWLIVAAGFCILYAAYGVQYSFGVFLPELERALAPGQRAATSLGYSIYVSLYSLLGFFSGWLTDRWGPRRVLVVGGLLLGSGIYLVGQAQSLWQYYLAYIVAALGMCTIFVPATSTTVRWFVEHRGLAVGLVALGASLGQVTVPLLSARLVSDVGWRGAYSCYGVALAIVVGLFALVMERGPEAKGLRPFGMSANASQSLPSVQERPSLTLREAMRTRALWLFIAGLFLAWSVTFLPMAHLPSFAQEVLGTSPAQGALMITAVGAGNCLGRLMGGWLSDILGRRRILVAAVVAQALAFLGLLFSGTLKSLALGYGSAAIFGASYGAIGVLYAALTGDLFGRRFVGSIAGLVFSLAGVSTGIGVFAAGAIYESTGGYTGAFAMSSALMAVSLPLFLLVKPPPEKRWGTVKET